MTAELDTRPRVVTATLNYMQPMAERPVAYQYQPEDGRPLRTGKYDPRVLAIHDARGGDERFSLDVQGFEVIAAPPLIADFYDDDLVRAQYYPSVERTLKAAVGAAKVIMFDHNVRNAARAEAGDPKVKSPVDRVHNDFTVRSGPERARTELLARGEDADAWLKHRFALINLWRPISHPVERSPLALADARSIAFNDLVPTDLVYRDRIGETYGVHFNPAHRWWFFADLRPDEAVLIKVYDSDESGVARFSAHGAFDDATVRPDAPARESIEARCLVFYPA